MANLSASDAGRRRIPFGPATNRSFTVSSRNSDLDLAGQHIHVDWHPEHESAAATGDIWVSGQYIFPAQCGSGFCADLPIDKELNPGRVGAADIQRPAFHSQEFADRDCALIDVDLVGWYGIGSFDLWSIAVTVWRATPL